MTGIRAGGIAAALFAVACVPSQGPSDPASLSADPQRANAADAWFHSPCETDSVDSFEWTRYDLRAIRIRVPREFRHVPYPDLNELRFQKGRTTLRLRLHNDASRLFMEYRTPQRTHRYCQGEMSGLPIEAVSFGGVGLYYGFAARWPDADQGEWLTAVVGSPILAEATTLRRALFTIQFPGERRRSEFAQPH